MLKDGKFPSGMKEIEKISNELNRFNVNDDSNNTTLEVDQSTNNHQVTPEHTADKDISDQQSSKQLGFR